MNNDKIFSVKRKVVAHEIDELQHVNNVVYVQWVQDIAKQHWEVLTKDHKLDDVVWVLIRHEIDYKNQAVLDDEVTVKTWVGETAGVTSVRYVESYKGTTLLTKSKTTWCLLDAKTFKPTRINDAIKNLMI
ncbi:acyl-CoA thioesterase [Tenacibaculum amylolyticum]|uniref:acyl-CoA thioesterase n=1 Tax=Tenacibaculum amylolyticum TaxID=104269 RepID=UPI00389439F4